MRWSSELQFSVPSSQFSVGSVLLRTENRELRTKVYFAILLASVSLLSAAPSAPSTEEKQLSVYSPVAIYTLPVLQRSGHEYVGLLELLEPLGRVSTESQGHSLRL